MTPYYDQDGITIYHGEALDVLRQLPPASADVILTDPPYSSGGMFRSDRSGSTLDKYSGFGASQPVDLVGDFSGDNRDQRGWAAWVGAWSWAALRITTSGGSCFVFSDWRQLPAATDALQLGGWVWRGIVTWDKSVARPHRGRFRPSSEFIAWGTAGPISEDAPQVSPSAVITEQAVRGGDRFHQTEKPVPLLSALLSVLPARSPVVLDPFVGSGSTLVAAKALGHRAIGIDIEERYCETAAQRLAQGVLSFD